MPPRIIDSVFAWWYLSTKQKQILEEEREKGRFGGETAKGVDRAPYYWPQEHGEVKAAITGKHYVGAAVRRFRDVRAPTIVRKHIAGV